MDFRTQLVEVALPVKAGAAAGGEWNHGSGAVMP
jgi:hypothetical protein